MLPRQDRELATRKGGAVAGARRTAEYTQQVLAPLACLAAIVPAPVEWRTLRRERPGWYSMRALVPVFRGTGLARYASQAAEAEARKVLDGFVRESAKEGKPERPWDVDWTATVGVARPGIVSFYSTASWYTGGAHPNREHKGHTFATLPDGKPARLGLGRVLRVQTVPDAWASLRVIPRLKAMGASSVVNGSMQALTPAQADNFMATPAGMTWLFSPYEAGSYAEGEYFVKLPWSELPGLDPSGPLAGLIP